MFDFLAEMPQHQRRNAGIAASEQKIAVIDDVAEDWQESCFDVRGVGKMEVEIFRIPQRFIVCPGFVQRLLKARILMDQRGHMLPVRLRMIPQLAP